MHTSYKSGYTTSNKPFASQSYQFKKQDFKKYGAIAAIALCLNLTACGTMTNRGKSTAIGAGVGAVAGAVLTGGSAWGTVGGAAVGGVVGNQIGK
jgi:osmotically inducible lipoprotein OsmB